MAKTKQQKEKEMTDLSERLQRAKAAVFASYQGLSVSQTEELRKQLRENEAELKMAKKRLLKLVLKKNKLDDSVVDNFVGSLTVAIGYGDETVPARTLVKFAKDSEAMNIFGGILENTLIPAAQVAALAALPSKTELLAKTVATIKAPVSGFVNVLTGNLRGLVYVLDAIKATKN